MASHRRHKAIPAPLAPAEPGAESVEKTLHEVAARIEDRLLHHCDRPEIEMKILKFLEHALGPTTDGVAREMGISSDAAAIHLQALNEANRTWSQPGRAGEQSWHISLEGRRYLADRAHR
jgi:predicted transcriptional regulator